MAIGRLRLPRRFTTDRWLAFVFSIFLTSSAGTSYITSLYLKELRDDWFHHSSTAEDSVEQLVFACNLGTWLPICGFLYDSRIGGPTTTALVGALFVFVGYCGLWLSLSGAFEPAFWQLWVLWFLWGHGSGYFDSAAVATSAFNFPNHRGRVMGVVKSMFGLSGSLVTQVYLAFYAHKGHAADFLLFLGISLPAVALVCCLFVHRVPPHVHREADHPERRFSFAYVLVMVLAGSLMAATVLRASTALGSHHAFSLGMLGVTAALLLAMLGAAWRAQPSAAAQEATAIPPAWSGDDTSSPPAERCTSNERLAPAALEGQSFGPSSRSDSFPVDGRKAASVPHTDAHILDSLRNVNFWLQFVGFLAGCGGGVVLINNLHPIVSAQIADDGVAKRTSDVLVSLLSIFNCLGRMGFGLVSDLLGRRAPRPFFLALALLMMTASHLLLLGAASVPLMYLGICVGGFAYGGLWSLTPTIAAELYGLRHFAITYGVFSLAATSASLLYSTVLASKVYDTHARPGPPGEGPQCDGNACFSLTHWVLISSTLVGALAASALTLRTRAFYAGRTRLA